MYEVCRVQKLSPTELGQFDDAFIDHLFEMVETTRDNQDERLNYAVIRLIVSIAFQGALTTGLIERAIHGLDLTVKTSKGYSCLSPNGQRSYIRRTRRDRTAEA
jgi:hypothetical protein